MKIFAWLLGIVIFLVLLVFILIQVPAVQNFAKEKAVAYLQDKIHTKVSIKKLSIDFPKQVVLEGVYFEDQKKDTLFSGEKLRVDIALFKLLSSEVVVNYIELDGIHAKISRSGKDTFFNYQYIIDAFADTATKTVKDTSEGMTFKVGDLVLNNINGSFKDDQTGIDFLMHIGKSKTSFETFDPTKMNFSVPLISFDGITGHMYQNKPLLEPEPESKVEAESNEPFDLKLSLKDIGFTNIKFDYRNDVSPMLANLELGELSGKVKSVDLSKLDVQLDQIKLHGTKANIALGKSDQVTIVKKEVKKEVKAQANNPWKVSVSNIDLANNNIVYDDNNIAPVRSGMDYSHLKIDSLTLNADDIVLTPTAYTGKITRGSFSEKSGFNLKALQTNFIYNDSGASLKSLLVQTDKTIIQNEIEVSYPSLDAVVKDMGSMYVNAKLEKSSLAVKDILLFAPQLETNLKGFENAVIAVNTTVKGYVKDISLPVLQVSGIGNTVLNMSGNIKGLPDPLKTVYDIRINNFTTTKADIVKLLPPGTLPSNINLPASVSATGTFSGSATNFITAVSMQTNKGGASLSGNVNTNAKTYNVKGNLRGLDVGYFIKQDTLIGKVTMSFAAKGSGFEPAKMNMKADINMASAYIKGYEYKNLKANASVNKGNSKITAVMNDRNIAFDLDAAAMINKNSASNVKLNLKLDSIALLPLGFTKNDLRLHGNINADIPVADLDAPQGIIRLDNLIVKNDRAVYKADSIMVTANNTDSGKLVLLQSQVVNAMLLGEYNLATVADGPMQVINKYYNLGLKDSAAVNDHWKLNMAIIPDSLLFVFVPSLRGTDTIKAVVGFNGSTDSLGMLVSAPKIQSGTQEIDSLTINAGNNGDRFVYGATLNKAGSKSFMLQRTSLTGYAKNNELVNDLTIKDANGKNKYELGLKVAQVNKAIKINLLDTLLLDYENWAVNNSNYILYDSAGIVIKNFAIDNAGQSLAINSQSESTAAPVDVVLKDFHIRTLTNFADQDSLIMDGIINGNAQVKNMMSNPVFTADLTVNDLSYNKDTIGNLIVKVNNETANTYTADVSITGKGNDVKLNGNYVTGTGNMDLLLNINSLNLVALKGFSQGALTDASGVLKGKVDIKGTASAPAVNGSLQFENADITPAATGEKLHLSNEEIAVANNNISFNHFTFIDSAGNKAVLDGDILTNNFTAYSFDLNFNADNFRALNSVKTPNSLYYGRLNIDADVSVKGPMEAPVVNADLVVNKETDVTIVLPGTNPEIESREGVVQFFDAWGQENSDSILKSQVDSLVKIKALAGMDITATIQSDTSAQITLITDERSGDAIKIRGKANLAGGIDKSGKISLTGSYQLQSGFYQVSLSVLKKQFAIQPGSIITWNGDPLTATVDMSATYTTNTQPINLLQSELASLSSADVSRYKARVPFNVVLKMKGDLMKPQITFDIKLAEDQKTRWPDVESKLAYIRGDEGELNKQVFALLLLNRFVQEDPLKNSGEGTSLATTAKSSVSKILADQINDLAASLIQGVDLNFGINAEDDYTSGTAQSRTDLTVGVSKKLLNDRLRVSVGSNFELEGPANANENASNIAGDIAVDYLMSKDGRYILRAYRKNRYEGVVEGQVVESGVSFIFTLDFDKLKQLLRKKTEEEKQQRAEDKRVEKAAEQKQKAAEEKQQDTPVQF